jgi:hypothetical protein
LGYVRFEGQGQKKEAGFILFRDMFRDKDLYWMGKKKEHTCKTTTNNNNFVIFGHLADE